MFLKRNQWQQPDVFVIHPDADRPDAALCLIAEIRARTATRHAGILVVLPDDLEDLKGQILDLGAHDVQLGGFDPEELLLRISNLVQQKKLNDRARASVQDSLQAAVTDPLTGLFNRRYALPQLNQMVRQAIEKNSEMTVLIVDLDNFKTVNDKNGHKGGDNALIETSRRLRGAMRPNDLVARLGGDEFLIAMPDISRIDAEEYAKNLCKIMRDAPISLSAYTQQIQVTLSIGGASSATNPAALSADRLIKDADRALYKAKANGRDQVTFCPIYA